MTKITIEQDGKTWSAEGDIDSIKFEPETGRWYIHHQAVGPASDFIAAAAKSRRSTGARAESEVEIMVGELRKLAAGGILFRAGVVTAKFLEAANLLERQEHLYWEERARSHLCDRISRQANETIAEQESRIDRLDKASDDLAALAAARAGEIADRDAVIAGRDERIKDLRAACEQKQEIIDSCQGILASMKKGRLG